MRVLILNSGRGSRLGEYAARRHKSMLELYNGESLLRRQIRLLGACGVQDFIITSGPFAEQLRETVASFAGFRFEFIPNARYAETNYIYSMHLYSMHLYSMHLAAEYLNGPLLLLHGDLVFDKGFAAKVLDHPQADCVAINCAEALPQKDFKARICQGKVQEIAVTIFAENCCACQPFYKLSAETARAWRQRIAHFVSQGNVRVYAENALNELLPRIPLHTCSYEGHYVAEIDTMEDYARVNAAIRDFDASASG